AHHGPQLGEELDHRLDGGVVLWRPLAAHALEHLARRLDLLLGDDRLGHGVSSGTCATGPSTVQSRRRTSRTSGRPNSNFSERVWRLLCSSMPRPLASPSCFQLAALYHVPRLRSGSTNVSVK